MDQEAQAKFDEKLKSVVTKGKKNGYAEYHKEYDDYRLDYLALPSRVFYFLVALYILGVFYFLCIFSHCRSPF